MKRIKLIIVGLTMAAVVGLILVQFWNLIVGAVAAVALFVLFAVAIFAGGGFLWDRDEDEDYDDEDDEGDEDDEERD